MVQKRYHIGSYKTPKKPENTRKSTKIGYNPLMKCWKTGFLRVLAPNPNMVENRSQKAPIYENYRKFRKKSAKIPENSRKSGQNRGFFDHFTGR